jgi:hypothetical protein
VRFDLSLERASRRSLRLVGRVEVAVHEKRLGCLEVSVRLVRSSGGPVELGSLQMEKRNGKAEVQQPSNELEK